MQQNYKKKILIIASEFPPDVGGIGNHAYNLAKYLALEGFTVSVVADLLAVNRSITKKIISELPFQFYPVYRNKLLPVTYLQRVIRCTRLSKKNDIIICSGKFYLWLIEILKPIFSGKKFIAVVHGSELNLPGTIMKQLTTHALKKFNAIIAVSTFTKSLLPLNLQKSFRIIVIPNGINNDEFTDEVSNNIAAKTKTLHIITVGSVTERKGQENVIRALPSMLNYFPELHYHIVGKPLIKSQLIQLINKLGMQHHVTFHGTVNTGELIHLLKTADVKILLSNNTDSGDVEGFGISILEANAVGKPAIGSSNTGIADAISDGNTGKLVNAKDTEAVAKALYEIINNYEYYSNNALQWAKEHDWRILIKKYVEVIQKAVYKKV
jgi:glycosyltransferase involved in cell wall biosynthesis